MADKKKLTQREVRDVLATLETEIRKLSEIGKVLAKSNFKKRTICLLLRDFTGVPMQDIASILDALPQMDKYYLKS